MLFLTGAEIRRCLAPDAALAAIEQALAIQEEGEYTSPDRLHMNCGGDGDTLLLMPCLTREALSTKLVSVFPRNSDHGRPVIDGLVVLSDPRTGEIQALMDGKTVTALRTGAVTGVSIRHLAPKGAETLGLVGCGVQAFDQARHACAAHPLRRLLLYGRSKERRDLLLERLTQELPGIEVRGADSIEAMMDQSQVVITATTAREPVLPDDPTLFEGKHCIAMGSFEAGVREYPDAVFERVAGVWVDTPLAMEESGELATPLERGLIDREQVETLGALIARGGSPDRGEHGTTFFKSVGTALFDLQAAKSIHERARELGLGIELDS